MTLFNLAKKNLRGNFSNYLVYFATIIFSIIIYYIFVSLQYSESIQRGIELSNVVSYTFQVFSVVLILFVASFILYSNSFFIRKRKREIGLYLMLGLRKKTIAKMLFYENFIMSLMALLIGIMIGTLLSKLFSMILIKLMGSTGEVDFRIPFLAVVQTIVVFMLINLVTSIQGYRLSYRFKLIELFHAENKGEERPKVSSVLAGIGIILLAFSYYIILRPFPEDLISEDDYMMKNYGLAFVTLIIGTFIFLRSATVYLLKLLQENKRAYYKGTRMIEITRLLFRFREDAPTYTVIALLSAGALSIFGATCIAYFNNEEGTKEVVPFSYTHLSRGQAFDSQIEKIIKADKQHPIKAKQNIPVIELEGKLSFQLDYKIDPVKFISASTFNQVTKALGLEETVSLSGNQATAILPRFTDYPESVFKDKYITTALADKNHKFTFVSMVKSHVLPIKYPDFFVVISDERFVELAKQKRPFTYISYEVENEKNTKATSERINPLIKGVFKDASFYTKYQKGKEAGALTLFIFGFLGLVFLAATGNVIYFKQLMEANEAKREYGILRKLGLSKKILLKSIRKQTFFVFGLPLALGILHSCVLLTFINVYISNVHGVYLMLLNLAILVMFVIIYAIYYVMAVHMYNRIVNR